MGSGNKWGPGTNWWPEELNSSPTLELYFNPYSSVNNGEILPAGHFQQDAPVLDRPDCRFVAKIIA